MPKTVAEILKESGLSDEQITAIDAKAMDGLTRVVSSANEAQDKAELALRAQREEYDSRIAPALASWADQDTRLSTENAAMRTYLDKIKTSGYLPPELVSAIPVVGAPATPSTPGSPTRTPDGRFIASETTPPPVVVDTKKIEADLAGAFTFAADTQWNYRRLFGKEMPDSPTALIREAGQNRMSPQEWAAKKYDFSGRETAIKAEEQKKHDDTIRAEVKAAVDKEWAEKVGNNPNIRIPVESQFSSVSKAVAEGKRTDPLKMTPEQRKSSTHANIQKEFAERSSMVQ